MLKKLLAASAATAALCSTAFAADLPRRTAPVVYAPVPVFTWTGFYIGGHAGYGFSEQDTITTTGNNPTTVNNVNLNLRPASLRSEREGFVGGGQIGFNYQVSNVVFGAEADISYTDFDHSTTFVSVPTAAAASGFTSNFRQRMDYLGTVRGRLGFAFDRVLVYGTGGFAYADVQQSVDFFGPTGVLQFTGRRSNTETGYAVGGGVEYALPTDSFLNVFNSSAVTLRGEYLYYNLGDRNVTVAGVAGSPGITAANVTGYNSRFDMEGHIARAAINFKFGTN